MHDHKPRISVALISVALYFSRFMSFPRANVKERKIYIWLYISVKLTTIPQGRTAAIIPAVLSKYRFTLRGLRQPTSCSSLSASDRSPSCWWLNGSWKLPHSNTDPTGNNWNRCGRGGDFGERCDRDQNRQTFAGCMLASWCLPPDIGERTQHCTSDSRHTLP